MSADNCVGQPNNGCLAALANIIFSGDFDVVFVCMCVTGVARNYRVWCDLI